jgi:hypothetical protein
MVLVWSDGGTPFDKFDLVGGGAHPSGQVLPILPSADVYGQPDHFLVFTLASTPTGLNNTRKGFDKDTILHVLLFSLYLRDVGFKCFWTPQKIVEYTLNL